MRDDGTDGALPAALCLLRLFGCASPALNLRWLSCCPIEQALKAERRWAVTGTPIQNSLQVRAEAHRGLAACLGP